VLAPLEKKKKKKKKKHRGKKREKKTLPGVVVFSEGTVRVVNNRGGTIRKRLCR